MYVEAPLRFLTGALLTESLYFKRGITMALVVVFTSLDIQPAVSPASFLLSLALSHSSKATHSSPLSAFLCLAAPALFPCTGFFWAFIRFSVSFLFDSLKRHENLFVAKLSYFTDVDKFLRHLQCVVVDFLFFHVFFLTNQIFYGLGSHFHGRKISPISQMQLFFFRSRVVFSRLRLFF